MATTTQSPPKGTIARDQVIPPKEYLGLELKKAR